MLILNYFFYINVKYILINRNNYSLLKKLPEFQKVLVFVKTQDFHLKDIAKILLLLSIITYGKNSIIKQRFSTVVVEGQLIGFKLIVSKKNVFKLMSQLVPLFPKKSYNKNIFNSILKSNLGLIPKLSLYKKISDFYEIFKSILFDSKKEVPQITVTFKTNCSKNELISIIKYLNFRIYKVRARV